MARGPPRSFHRCTRQVPASGWKEAEELRRPSGSWRVHRTAHKTSSGKVIQAVVLKAYSASAAVMVCSNVSRGRR